MEETKTTRVSWYMDGEHQGSTNVRTWALPQAGDVVTVRLDRGEYISLTVTGRCWEYGHDTEVSLTIAGTQAA